jgi:hypothetical protein
MKFRIIFWDARTSETSVDNYFARQYIPEDNSEQTSYSSLTSALDGVNDQHYGPAALYLRERNPSTQ